MATERERLSIPYAALAMWLAVGVYLAWLLARLALHPTLTSVSDDSSNYLVMARHYSPWVAQSEAIRSVWPLQYFPPLFPMLLAVSGAAHSVLAAHALVVSLGLLCIPLLQRVMRCEFSLASMPAQLVALIVALLPGYALGLQGVLSESLFLLLTLALLLAMPVSGARVHPMRLAGCTLLLAAAMLTRSAGIVLALAVLAQTLVMAAREQRAGLAGVALVVLATLVYALGMRLFGPERGGEYLRIWHGLVDAGAGSDPGFWQAQLAALVESWCAFLTVYWRSDQPAGVVIAGAVLVLALGGLLARLRGNRLDAWYVALSLLMLLAWPFPGQMMRLLFPLVPLLMAQSAWALWRLCAARRHGVHAALVCAALLGAVILPPHAYLNGRIVLARELGQVPVYEWLRKPERGEARRELGLQNQMLRDFAALPAMLAPQEWLAYYEPSYVALLADHRCEPLDYPPDLDAVRARGRARHVLLTEIHPRLSRSTIEGLMLTGGEPVEVRACTTEPLDGRPASCLLRLE